ncbi:MAG: hypothetical protein ACLQDC_12380, partial [Verrucomicrobiia bacterium]
VKLGMRDGFDPHFVAVSLGKRHPSSPGRLMTVSRDESFYTQKSMPHVISGQWGVYPMAVPTIGLIIALES